MFCFLLVIILATVHIYFFHYMECICTNSKYIRYQWFLMYAIIVLFQTRKKNRCEQLKTVFFSQRVKSVFVFIYVDTNTEFTSCANITKRLDLVAMILFLFYFFHFHLYFLHRVFWFFCCFLLFCWSYSECMTVYVVFFFLFISFDMVMTFLLALYYTFLHIVKLSGKSLNETIKYKKRGIHRSSTNCYFVCIVL